MHNGSIKVESVFGQGSRFIITLPWSPENTTPLPAMPQHLAAKGTGSLKFPKDARPPIIFLVDDNEVVLQMVADYLESKRYRVVQLHSGTEVLTQIEEHQPDLILMDVQMPGIDGLEAIRRVRAHKNPMIAATPIIAVTALAMSGDRENCIRAGANDYISKPIKLKELHETIKKQIENKK
jgi:CheY-like chemotaxis protein